MKPEEVIALVKLSPAMVALLHTEIKMPYRSRALGNRSGELLLPALAPQLLSLQCNKFLAFMSLASTSTGYEPSLLARAAILEPCCCSSIYCRLWEF